MTFHGTALLAACLVAGLFLGTLLGRLTGIDADIGGVGIAMLLLIGTTSWLYSRGWWGEPPARGLRYWGEIYIPVIVAMAATQNVRGALSGGWVAVAAGVLGVGALALSCRILIRLAGRGDGPPASGDPP